MIFIKFKNVGLRCINSLYIYWAAIYESASRLFILLGENAI